MSDLTLEDRRLAIEAILEARFSIAAFEKIRRGDPAYSSSPRNEMGRRTTAPDFA